MPDAADPFPNMYAELVSSCLNKSQMCVQVAERMEAAFGQAAAEALRAQLEGEWRAFKTLRRRLSAPRASPPDYAPAGGSAAAAAATPAAPRSILKRAPAPDAPEVAGGSGGGIDDDSSAELLTLPDLLPTPEPEQAAAGEGPVSVTPAAARAAGAVQHQKVNDRLTPERGSVGKPRANEVATRQPLRISGKAMPSTRMPVVAA